jgi:hypothetical protein
MFKDGGSSEGTFVMTKDSSGNPLTWMNWYKNLDGDIVMTVNQPGQPPTTITVPLAQWQF